MVLIGFATAAFSRLLVHERGPWGVLEKTRQWALKTNKTFLGGLVTCAICAGLWIALILIGLVVLLPPARAVLLPFAAMGLAYLALGMMSLYSGPPSP